MVSGEVGRADASCGRHTGRNASLLWQVEGKLV